MYWRSTIPESTAPAPTTVSADRECKRQVLHLFGCVCLPFMQPQCEAGSRLPHNRLHCKNRSAARSAIFQRPPHTKNTAKCTARHLAFFWRGMSGRFLQKQAESPQPFCFSENAFYFYLVPEEFLGYNKRGNHIRR